VFISVESRRGEGGFLWFSSTAADAFRNLSLSAQRGVWSRAEEMSEVAAIKVESSQET